MAVTLKAEPDWPGAAQALISALEAQPDDEGRVQVIDHCRDALGDQVYPAFIKLLAAVARFAEPGARALVAQALAHALATARLPATRLPAWGAADPLAAVGLGRGLPQANLRAVGPVEFLCLWLHRDVAAEPLAPEAFVTAMSLLLDLLDASPEAAGLYRAKLAADLESPTEGLHTAASRRATRVLAEAWAEGVGAEAAARRTLAAAQADLAADRWRLPVR